MVKINEFNSLVSRLPIQPVLNPSGDDLYQYVAPAGAIVAIAGIFAATATYFSGASHFLELAGKVASGGLIGSGLLIGGAGLYLRRFAPARKKRAEMLGAAFLRHRQYQAIKQHFASSLKDGESFIVDDPTHHLVTIYTSKGTRTRVYQGEQRASDVLRDFT